jgi:hypothetical protein
VSILAIWVEHLAVKIVEVSHNYTSTKIHSINFGGGLGIIERAILDLHDIAIWHVAYYETVLHSQIDAWTPGGLSNIILFEHSV